MAEPETKTVWWSDPVIGSFLRDIYALSDAMGSEAQGLAAKAEAKIIEAQGGVGGDYVPTSYDFTSQITN